MKRVIVSLALFFGILNADIVDATTDIMLYTNKTDHEMSQNIEVYDPFEGYNRVITAVNSAFYDYLFYPIAFGYDYVVPDPIQGAFLNFIDNLLYPVRLLNNLLQGDLNGSWGETKRFLINTTLGFAGFSDAASLHFSLPRYSEDFGQTLGVWGISSGPHIVWPILGHSNFRDSLGLVGDYFANPIGYINDDPTRYGVGGGKKLNEFSTQLDPYNALKLKNDPYAFSRDMYYLQRQKAIRE